MRKNINHVPAESFLSTVEAAGLKVTPQSGFYRVEGTENRRLYIGKTKRVGRVDLSGYSVLGAGFTQLSEEDQFCRVACQLDFSTEPKVILAAFARAVKALTAPAKKSAKTPAKKLGEKAAKVSAPAVDSSPVSSPEAVAPEAAPAA